MKIASSVVEVLILLGVGINSIVGVLNYIANNKRRSDEY